MKPIEQWLQELPEPYKSQALANMYWEYQHDKCISLAAALHIAFNWSRSPEKYMYWKELSDTLTKDLV